MFAALLNQLPSVRLSRELAVSHETIRQQAELLHLEGRERRRAELALEQLQKKYDRLVEARLFTDGAIRQRITEPETRPTSAPSPFGSIGKLVDRRQPAGATEDEPAGAAMTP